MIDNRANRRTKATMRNNWSPKTTLLLELHSNLQPPPTVIMGQTLYRRRRIPGPCRWTPTFQPPASSSSSGAHDRTKDR